MYYIRRARKPYRYHVGYYAAALYLYMTICSGSLRRSFIPGSLCLKNVNDAHYMWNISDKICTHICFALLCFVVVGWLFTAYSFDQFTYTTGTNIEYLESTVKHTYLTYWFADKIAKHQPQTSIKTLTLTCSVLDKNCDLQCRKLKILRLKVLITSKVSIITLLI